MSRRSSQRLSALGHNSRRVFLDNQAIQVKDLSGIDQVAYNSVPRIEKSWREKLPAIRKPRRESHETRVTDNKGCPSPSILNALIKVDYVELWRKGFSGDKNSRSKLIVQKCGERSPVLAFTCGKSYHNIAVHRTNNSIDEDRRWIN